MTKAEENEIFSLLSEENSFERNPDKGLDETVNRAIRAAHNKRFKNNARYDNKLHIAMKNADVDCLFLDVDKPIDHYLDTSSTATTSTVTYLSDSCNSCDSQYFMTDESHPLNGNA